MSQSNIIRCSVKGIWKLSKWEFRRHVTKVIFDCLRELGFPRNSSAIVRFFTMCHVEIAHSPEFNLLQLKTQRGHGNS